MATQSAAEKWADAIGLNEKNLVRFQAIAAFNAGLELAAKIAENKIIGCHMLGFEVVAEDIGQAIRKATQS